MLLQKGEGEKEEEKKGKEGKEFEPSIKKKILHISLPCRGGKERGGREDERFVMSGTLTENCQCLSFGEKKKRRKKGRG